MIERDYYDEESYIKYLLSRIEELEASKRRLIDGIEKHKTNNTCKDHGIFWWKIDTELYSVAEEEGKG